MTVISHIDEAEFLNTDDCIVMIKFLEFADFEEQNEIELRTFQCPPQEHRWLTKSGGTKSVRESYLGWPGRFLFLLRIFDRWRKS